MSMWIEINYLSIRARVDFCEPGNEASFSTTERKLQRSRAAVRLEEGPSPLLCQSSGCVMESLVSFIFATWIETGFSNMLDPAFLDAL